MKGIGQKTIERVREHALKEDGYISEFNPNLKPELNSVNQGDCLELMNGIPDKSIDMILADLPYGTTACSWDSIIDLDKLWLQYERIIKDSGAIVLTASQPFTTKLINSNISLFKYDWVWKKPRGTGHLNANKQPMKDKEDVLVFYKNQCLYNPQFTDGEPYSALKGGKENSLSLKGETTYGDFINGADYRNDNDGFRYPKQIIEFGVVERNTLHPTQKPVDLFEYLIKTYTSEGDIILDNVAGSGTTGVAAKNTGRNFILMEQEEEYVEIIKERLASLDE